MKISSWIDRIKKDLAKRVSKDEAFKKKNRRLIERILLHRLRILGFILLGFSILFFFYALTHSPSEEVTAAASKAEVLSTDFFSEECSPHDTFNFFSVSAIFALVGASCLMTSWKHSKKTNPKIKN